MTEQQLAREIRSGWTRTAFQLLGLAGAVIAIYVALVRDLTELQGIARQNQASIIEMKSDRQRDRDKADALNQRLSNIEGDIKAMLRQQELMLQSIRSNAGRN